MRKGRVRVRIGGSTQVRVRVRVKDRMAISVRRAHKRCCNAGIAVLYSESKSCATIHSFITLIDVGQFSNFFHCYIL